MQNVLLAMYLIKHDVTVPPEQRNSEVSSVGTVWASDVQLPLVADQNVFGSELDRAVGVSNHQLS